MGRHATVDVPIMPHTIACTLFVQSLVFDAMRSKSSQLCHMWTRIRTYIRPQCGKQQTVRSRCFANQVHPDASPALTRQAIKSSSMASNSSLAKGTLSSSVPMTSLRLVMIWWS